MYSCPKCNKLEKGKFNKIVKCECGIYKQLVRASTPYWLEVQESALDENRNKLYDSTRFDRF